MLNTLFKYKGPISIIECCVEWVQVDRVVNNFLNGWQLALLCEWVCREWLRNLVKRCCHSFVDGFAFYMCNRFLSDGIAWFYYSGVIWEIWIEPQTLQYVISVRILIKESSMPNKVYMNSKNMYIIWDKDENSKSTCAWCNSPRQTCLSQGSTTLCLRSFIIDLFKVFTKSSSEGNMNVTGFGMTNILYV